MGSGKTRVALLLIQAIIQLMPYLLSISFGLIDPKGELFEAALFCLACRLNELDSDAQDQLLRRIVLIDFSSTHALTSYNVLCSWPGTEMDFFIRSRLETILELFPDKLSPRGVGVLKHVLLLLGEFGLPISYFDAVITNESLRYKLVTRSRNAAVRTYFANYFPKESQATIAALRARVDSLFVSSGVRLALSGSSAPDFRRLQNEGTIVLVNLSGPTITRGVRSILQGLLLSDIRQSIFTRPNNPPVTYLWFLDEGQTFLSTRQMQENLTDLLTMGRSFGSFVSLLTQNISAAVPDARILSQLLTNIRWSLSLRSTPQDAAFLRSALPVTGRRRRPRSDPFHEPGFYTPQEERSLLLDSIASLPDRHGFLWLRTRSPEAIQIRTQTLSLPQGERFRAVVEAIRQDPRIGGRLSRTEYEQLIAERDQRWLMHDRDSAELRRHMARAYRRQEDL
jgi:hypothetical protein